MNIPVKSETAVAEAPAPISEELTYDDSPSGPPRLDHAGQEEAKQREAAKQSRLARLRQTIADIGKPKSQARSAFDKLARLWAESSNVIPARHADWEGTPDVLVRENFTGVRYAGTEHLESEWTAIVRSCRYGAAGVRLITILGELSPLGQKFLGTVEPFIDESPAVLSNDSRFLERCRYHPTIEEDNLAEFKRLLSEWFYRRHPDWPEEPPLLTTVADEALDPNAIWAPNSPTAFLSVKDAVPLIRDGRLQWHLSTAPLEVGVDCSQGEADEFARQKMTKRLDCLTLRVQSMIWPRIGNAPVQTGYRGELLLYRGNKRDKIITQGEELGSIEVLSEGRYQGPLSLLPPCPLPGRKSSKPAPKPDPMKTYPAVPYPHPQMPRAEYQPQ